MYKYTKDTSSSVGATTLGGFWPATKDTVQLKYIVVLRHSSFVLLLVDAMIRVCCPFTSTKEATLIGRISDVVRSGRGPGFIS